jgi:predicted transcriptional regulator
LIDIDDDEKKENIRKKKSYEQNEEIDQKIWDSISKNFETIEGAQLSNSFIILLALKEGKRPMSSTQISEVIAYKTKGQIYKVSATLKDSLEHRLKREGYVDSKEIKNKSIYSITSKGKKLLKGWISFLEAFD